MTNEVNTTIRPMSPEELLASIHRGNKNNNVYHRDDDGTLWISEKDSASPSGISWRQLS